MLKWINDETEWTLHTLEAENGLADATPADIIACLRANTEEQLEVLKALTPSHDALLARAERAEQALATVTAERDEAHAALRDCATRLGNGSAVSAQASHAFHCQVPTEVGIAVDALKAKLAEAERERDEARAERDAKQSGYEALGKILTATCEPAHDYAQEFKCGHAGEDVVAVVVRDARDLRSRLAKLEAETNDLTTLDLRAKLARVTDERNALRSALTDSQEAVVASMRERLARYEAVVEAAREEHRILARDRARTGWGSNDMIYAMCQTSVALRALNADTGGEQTDSPRAIVDSDTAAVGAVDSTPGLSRLASAEPGDVGSGSGSGSGSG